MIVNILLSGLSHGPNTLTQQRIETGVRAPSNRTLERTFDLKSAIYSPNTQTERGGGGITITSILGITIAVVYK